MKFLASRSLGNGLQARIEIDQSSLPNSYIGSAIEGPAFD
jgi:hypothetical protein